MLLLYKFLLLLFAAKADKKDRR